MGSATFIERSNVTSPPGGKENPPGVVLLKETVVGTEPPGTDDDKLTVCPEQMVVCDAVGVTGGAALTLTVLVAILVHTPLDTV
jgi:hypothetical protein